MRWSILIVSFLILLLAGLAAAAGLQVVEGVVTTAVADRRPVDVVQVYPSSVEKLYCFTELTGATEETTVAHIWYYGGREIGRSVLPVRNSYWRTWSARAIRPDWAGEWRVEVVDAEGELLQRIPFKLTAP